MKNIIFTILLMAFTPVCIASGAQIYTEVSLEGETMDDFIVRISRMAMSETIKISAEVCGEIETINGIHHLTIITSGDAFSCELPNTGKPYFHTHPPSSIGTFSPADRKYKGYLAAKGRVYYQDGWIERRIGRITSK